MPSSRCSWPTWNQETPAGAYVPPPPTKCHSTPRDITKAAPTATIPYTLPRPGVRLPKKRVRTAETTGSSGMTHAYVRKTLAGPVAVAATT